MHDVQDDHPRPLIRRPVQGRRARAIRSLIVVPLGFLLAGCALGPNYKPYPSLSASTKNLAGKTVVVSGLMGSRYTTSVTHSADILTIREAIGTRDISPEIAQALRANGIDAEARVGFSHANLGSDGVLLTGTVRVGGGGYWDASNGLNWLNFAIVAGTLGIVGMILPTPIPWTANVSVSYNVDVLDREGRFLAHSGEQFTEAVFNNYYFWGVASQSVNPKTFQDFTKVLGDLLSDWFR